MTVTEKSVVSLRTGPYVAWIHPGRQPWLNRQHACTWLTFILPPCRPQDTQDQPLLPHHLPSHGADPESEGGETRAPGHPGGCGAAAGRGGPLLTLPLPTELWPSRTHQEEHDGTICERVGVCHVGTDGVQVLELGGNKEPLC